MRVQTCILCDVTPFNKRSKKVSEIWDVFGHHRNIVMSPSMCFDTQSEQQCHCNEQFELSLQICCIFWSGNDWFKHRHQLLCNGRHVSQLHKMRSWKLSYFLFITVTRNAYFWCCALSLLSISIRMYLNDNKRRALCVIRVVRPVKSKYAHVPPVRVRLVCTISQLIDWLID